MGSALRMSKIRSSLKLGSLRSPDAGDGSLECGFNPEKIHFLLPLFETLLSPFPGSPRPFQINIFGGFSCCGQYGNLGGQHLGVAATDRHVLKLASYAVFHFTGLKLGKERQVIGQGAKLTEVAGGHYYINVLAHYRLLRSYHL